MIATEAFLIVAFFIVCAVLSAFIADEKGFSAAVGLVGFFLGPIGLMFAMGLPDRKARPTQKP